MTTTKTVYWTSPCKGWLRQHGTSKCFRIADVTGISAEKMWLKVSLRHGFTLDLEYGSYDYDVAINEETQMAFDELLQLIVEQEATQ